MKVKLLPSNRITPELDQTPDLATDQSAGTSTAASSPSTPPSSDVEDHARRDADVFYDLVVIGSGPAALALVSRIFEVRPAALYTEGERRHLHWLSLRNDAALIPSRNGRKRKVGSTKPAGSHPRPGKGFRILIIDKLGGWLEHWRVLFRAYRIPYLRSPMFFHLDPSDFDALLAYAQREERSQEGCIDEIVDACCRPMVGEGQDLVRGLSELIAIPGVVGSEKSKHRMKTERKGKRISAMGPPVNELGRRDYFTPSSALFEDFVDESVVRRYGLEGEWKTMAELLDAEPGEDIDRPPVDLVKGSVSRLEWDDEGEDVGVGVEGPQFRVCLDDGSMVVAKAVVSAVGTGGIPNIPPYLHPPDDKHSQPWGRGWAHSAALANPAFRLPRPSKTRRLLVIGGGLTSAQLVPLTLAHGYEHVTLVMRGHLKVKPFDFDLEWVGRYANIEKMRFWQLDNVEDRARMMREARNGGSINPVYARVLKKLQEQGKARVLTHTVVDAVEWINGAWCVKLASCVPGGKKHPIKEFGGLPVLTADLQYTKDIPLFCVGAYSAIQMGPGAFNLGGMREAADRVAARLDDLIKPPAAGNRMQVETGTVEEGRPHKQDFSYFGFDALPVEV